ncbi:MAG: DegT/DnrJ/EryC1/StrS family aminotransferase [Theionarchaea archaeon]|nr:DegT/DnrJ/EryC1/StrS family aminotransferase [Theionarchaea archaeon]
MNWKIPLFKIYWDESDVASVTSAIERGMNWAIGPEVQAFESKIAEYCRTRYCVVFNSGTSALHAQLLSHGISQGDEVIVPSFTFIATANAPLFVNAKPVFADIEAVTCGLDPEDVEKKITAKTKAIIPVHFGGCPCNIERIKDIAEEHELILIEDAAEAFGAHIAGKYVGTYGDSAMFSFCQNKLITTGDGGAVVTDSQDLYEKLKLFRSHGRAENTDYFSSAHYMDYIQVGYNFRMSNITASLGLSQIGKVDEIIKKRRENAAYLNDRLLEIEGMEPPHPPQGYFHVYQMYTVRAHDRDALLQHLIKNGIMAKVYFHPVHRSHFYETKLKYRCNLPVTERMSHQVLTLPMYPHLTEKEMDFLIQAIHEFYGGSSS